MKPRSPASKANSANKSNPALSKQNVQILNASKYGIRPNLISKAALSIVDKLHNNGYEAYVVGGCLRDILLGKKPKDFDIATNARPEQIQTIFQRKCRLIGRRFRLAHIMCGREIIEVATFRANHTDTKNEQQSKQSAEGMLLRDNVYGNMEQDAQRRDFSVNSLYYDPKRDQLYDYFNAIADIQAGKLRLIGDAVTRYQEDPVRMLRAIRFMAKLDMFLDKTSEAPIRQLAGLLKNIPPARLFDESLKLLQAGAGLKTYQLLREYGLFEQLFPALSAFFTTKADSFAERMITHALNATDERIKDNLGINPAFLFAALHWYPLREKVEILKNEGGLNNADAHSLAANDMLNDLCRSLAIPKRHTSVIRDIWWLQLRLTKRTGSIPARLIALPKFRAGYDLLAMRAEIEGGESIELAAWWHEYQLSNEQQRSELVKAQNKLNPKTKRKTYRQRNRKKTNKIEK